LTPAFPGLKFRDSDSVDQSLHHKLHKQFTQQPAALSERSAKASNMALTQQLTPEGNQAIQDLAQRYGVSVDAVRTLLFAVSEGGGTLAQFSHPELGGGGQWMRGGMTMVGDMFNDGLKATVSGLCSELSSLLSSQQIFVPLPPQSARGGSIAPRGNAWWPAELGQAPPVGKTMRATPTFRKASGSPFCRTGRSDCMIPWTTTLGASSNSREASPAL